MQKGLVFEKNLEHQTQAVESIIKVFKNLPVNNPTDINTNFINPTLDNKNSSDTYRQNIKKLQEENSIAFDAEPTFSNIIDIMMETGTGKTYTYTKAMFELNKHYGIFKFIIIVPTLSIKAGTVNFLKSESAREHFKEQYGKTINLYVVESQKNSKNKKNYMPASIRNFVRSNKNDKNSIQVLLINAGMLNSDTLKKDFDRTIFDIYTKPFDALAKTNSFVIIDEPHRFAQENKTWQNIKLLKSQYILRFGATFKEYENLIYTLTAVDAFNKNLVKGVIAHIEEFDSGKNVFVRLVNTDGREATFELVDNNNRTKIKLAKKDSLEKIHSAMQGLIIEKLNKSEVLLSNGLSLRKGNRINPFSYSETLQENMIKKAVKEHFEIERKLLTQKPRIKPLTLFFIDNIEEYRNENGYLRRTLEDTVKSIAKELLDKETDKFYKEYLEKTIKNVEETHGGYFSKDNIESDEKIEKEVNEILHDKEALLDLNNPRRFIFSKWTLREGWDNPNVFQICKLRSSGSEISKLQEVGRGLRLPVNEYMSRVKDRQFYLNYFVDFTENDFVDRLVNEINEKSNAISAERIPEKLDENMIKKILEVYSDRYKDENSMLEDFIMNKKIVDFSHKFINNGFDYIRQNFSLIFEGVGSNKIRRSTDSKKKVRVRTGKYSELKELWEELNKKSVLEYKFKDEDEFKNLFKEFVEYIKDKVGSSNMVSKKVKIDFVDNKATATEEYLTEDMEIIPVVTMSYHSFLKELAKEISANPKTLHSVFKEILKNGFNINNYLNVSTIRMFKQGFNNFLLYKSINKFKIAYQEVKHTVHPTKLTDKNGNPLEEIDAHDLGIMFDNKAVAKNYYFEELFYDSELEKENITTDIEEVIVFTKIPKNSIKIPVSGGGSYSPDFAYVLKSKDSDKRLYFVLETKDVNSEDKLRKEELQKIKHAQIFFGEKIKFETQFSNKKIVELIREIYAKQCAVM